MCSLAETGAVREIQCEMSDPLQNPELTDDEVELDDPEITWDEGTEEDAGVEENLEELEED